MEAGVEADWEFLLRVTHQLAGIVWLGLTFHFNLIHSEYMQEALPDARTDVIRKLVPLGMTWSRWAALVTFLSGFTLLFSSSMRHPGWNVDITIGALLGILMFVNVWFLIWPQYRIACGLVPGDAAVAGPRAQVLSRTNVLFSVSMVLFMVSSAHLPGVMLRDAPWLRLVAAVLLIGACELNAVRGQLWPPLRTVRGQIVSAVLLALLLWVVVHPG